MAKKLIQDRYRLLGRLGKGGMGTVHKAEDTQSPGRIIALKRIDLAGTDKLPFLRHEFKTLVELHHPNLGEVYDFGEIPEKKEWFFTSEYIDGSDLLSAGRQMSWEQFLDVVVQICHALEYIHSRNIVHHDVKPRNILVRGKKGSRPEVKIVDFGLAGQGAAPTTGSIRGTVHYLAPEVIRGDAVDGRADLYSLGATLYHCVTGRPVFEGDTNIWIIRQHLHATPLPPQELRHDLPDALGTLLMNLLAKSPADRIQSANQVIREINRTSTRHYPLETEEAAGTLLHGCFVGRDRELTLLSDILSRRIRGDRESKTLVLLEGQPGVGKSRLLREFQIQCKVDGIPFLHGPCFEEGDKPLGPLGQVITDLLPIYEARERHQLEEGTQPNIRGRFRDELQRLRPELLDPEVSTPPPQAEGEDAKLTFLERLARLFLEVLKDTPAVIYLSELHWSHESALEFLEYLAGAAAEERFLLIGSYRPGEIRENASKEILTRLARRNFAEVIRLGGIDQAEVALLARSVLGTAEMPEGLVDYLHQGTGGNPFFVEEAMKQLNESGTLFYSGGRWILRSDAGVDSAIPSEISEMIVHRLERLSFAFREILEALAAFERPATPELLTRMTGREPQDLLENLRLLEMQELISREGSESGPRFSITHALVREVAYESMDRARRKEFHGHISDWMMVEEGESPRGNLEALAHHLFRGPYPARSVPFLIAAGDRSRWLHGDEAAIRFYMEALTILGEDDPVTSLQLLEALGAIQQRVGRYDAAIKLQKKMIQLARRQRDPLALGRAYLRISEVLKLKGEYEGAATHAEKALGLFRDSESSEDVSKALTSLGSIHWVQGDHSRALQSFEECLEVNRGIGDSLGEAAALGHIGKIHWARGDHDRSVECYTESLRLREEQEDLLGTASSLAELGEIHWARGEYSDAMESFSRSLSIRREVGDPLGVATSLELIARVHSGRGEYGLALQACAESLKILARVGNRPGLACALASIGEIYLMLSDLPVAAHFQGQALSEAREIGDRELEATILCDAALCRLRAENLAEAKNLLKQSQGLGDVSEQTELRARIDYGLACVALVEGDTREARIRGERIIESGETIRSPRLEALGLLLRGETSLRAGMKDPAQGDIQRALDIAGHLGDPELVWQASHAAGRAAIQRQRLEDAARHFRSGVAVIEGVAHSLNEDSRHTYLSDRRKRAFRDDALALRELLGV